MTTPTPQPPPPCAEPVLRIDEVRTWTSRIPVNVLWYLTDPETGATLAHGQAPTVELAEHRAAGPPATRTQHDQGGDMSAQLGIGGHHRGHRGETNIWLTPPEIVKALGPFDLDPCAAVGQPWPTATKHYTIEEDGLAQPWHGFVWCNPPYGPEMGTWMAALAAHGDGVGLIFARTETADFFEQVWGKATGLLFIKGRLHFHHPDGSRAKANSGAPSVSVAYGQRAWDRLRIQSDIRGRLVCLREPRWVR